MEPLTTVLQSGLIFVVGLLLRFLLALAVLAVLVVPLFLAFTGVRGLERLRDRLTGLARAGHLWWRRGVYYAPGHTWVKERDGRTVRVGLDDLAQRMLVGLRGVRVVEPGTTVYRGQVLADVDLGDRHATIAAPVDATVVSANTALAGDPDLVHRDPYRRGWLAVLAPLTRDYAGLRTGELARAWLEDEDVRFGRFLEHELGMAAADGGDFVMPPARILRPEQWDALTREFLGTIDHREDVAPDVKS